MPAHTHRIGMAAGALMALALASGLPADAASANPPAATAPAPEAATPATQPDLDRYLTRQPWRDAAYGLTLRPPLGSHLSQATAGDALDTIRGKIVVAPYVVQVHVRKSTGPMDLPKVVEEAIAQLGLLLPGSRVLAQRELRVGGRPTALISYQLEDRKGQKMHMVQAFMAIDPALYAYLTLETPVAGADKVRPVFDAVIHSLEIQDPKALAKLREEMLQRGQAWLKDHDLGKFLALAGEAQFYRIQQGSKDIGYMRLAAGAATEGRDKGLKVVVESRLALGEMIHDTVSTFFVSQDLRRELWSVNTTTRENKPRPGTRPTAPVIWKETGIREDKTIQVFRDGPDGRKKLAYTTPDLGYLPQASLQIMAPLLPRQPVELAFYAYNPVAGKLSLRTDRVAPGDDGGFTVHSRPSLEQPEAVSRYDAAGKLIERQLGEGRVVKPATREEISAIWKN